MQVIIRVDASQRIGTGHLVRCKTLAEVLRQRGASVGFICREHQGHLIDWLLKADFQVTGLPIQSPPSSVNDLSEDYQAWLGVTPEQDAQETIQAIGNNHPDWLIIDHYGIDQQWETQLRPHVQKILVIDDLANRYHDCDVLLDQNNHLGGIKAYLGLVPKSCHLLFIGSSLRTFKFDLCQLSKSATP
jgi:UDP-2,4-diacetamido-2,4,6-trideoxy-beta-L-altropyranose hydrolase